MDSPKLSARLLHRGAEADLFISRLGPWDVVIKQRGKKPYRSDELDKRIRAQRTIREASGLRDAKRSGVRAPSILDVDLQSYAIVMTYVRGLLARDTLDSLRSSSRSTVLRKIGYLIGLLHAGGLVHGDLTTSNIIIGNGQEPFLLDFGMSWRSHEPEDRGVDIHLMQRSIATSHLVDLRSCLTAIAQGYRKASGERQAKLSFMKAAEISRRGRYFAIR